MQNNLRKLRKAAGLTQEQLGNLCEPAIPHVYISRYEGGIHAMPEDALRKLSKALNVSRAELLGYEDVDQPATSAARQVPIVGYVGAGAQVYPYDDHAKGTGFDEVDCPANMDPHKTLAVEVKGESMEPLISEGFLLFYDRKVYGVPDEYIGKVCIVKIVDGPTLVKRVKKGSAVGKFKLICINPAEATIEAEVEWSAMVKTMVQR